MILDIFAFIVILVIIAVIIWFVIFLGPLPGKIAKQRNHPQAEAINVLGWIGLITLGLGWLIALVWAYIRSDAPASQTLALEKRVILLEQQLEDLLTGGSES